MGNYFEEEDNDKDNYINYIIAEINIKEKDINKDIRIINTYEQTKREYKWVYGIKNEKEIKKYTEIKIDNNIIPFSYTYKFNKAGKFKIQYSFITYLTNINYLFFMCDSMTLIDLSNFKSNKVTDMYRMFSQCFL